MTEFVAFIFSSFTSLVNLALSNFLLATALLLWVLLFIIDHIKPDEKHHKESSYPDRRTKL